MPVQVEEGFFMARTIQIQRVDVIRFNFFFLAPHALLCHDDAYDKHQRLNAWAWGLRSQTSCDDDGNDDEGDER